MMTSFAFILGLLPLVIAEGPSMLARRNVGTPVFAGMLAASTLGIFVIPMLYVVFQAVGVNPDAVCGVSGGAGAGEGREASKARALPWTRQGPSGP